MEGLCPRITSSFVKTSVVGGCGRGRGDGEGGKKCNRAVCVFVCQPRLPLLFDSCMQMKPHKQVHRGKGQHSLFPLGERQNDTSEDSKWSRIQCEAVRFDSIIIYISLFPQYESQYGTFDVNSKNRRISTEVLYQQLYEKWYAAWSCCRCAKKNDVTFHCVAAGTLVTWLDCWKRTPGNREFHLLTYAKEVSIHRLEPKHVMKA